MSSICYNDKQICQLKEELYRNISVAKTKGFNFEINKLNKLNYGKMNYKQCRLNAWTCWAVARGPMLIYVYCVQHVFLMFKHWFCWKYQYNKHMFNFIDIYCFIPVSGCVGMSPSALHCSGVYNAVKTALIMKKAHTGMIFFFLSKLQYVQNRWKMDLFKGGIDGYSYLSFIFSYFIF